MVSGLIGATGRHVVAVVVTGHSYDTDFVQVRSQPMVDEVVQAYQWNLSPVWLDNAQVGFNLKAPRKMHRKMWSAEGVCCKKIPNITDDLSIEANNVDPEQTAPIHYNFCHT